MAQAGVAHRVDHVLDSFLRRIATGHGDHRPDSDYDVFVVLRERTREAIDRLYDAVVDEVCEFGSLVC